MLTRDSVKCDNELPSVIKCHREENTLAFRIKFFFFINIRVCFIKHHEHPNSHISPVSNEQSNFLVFMNEAQVIIDKFIEKINIAYIFG